jgi:hypothetical protein
MNDFQSLCQVALNESCNLISDTINYKSEDLTCIVSDVKITEELLDGGLMEKRGIKITLPKDESLIPLVGDKLIYLGKSYRIMEVSSDYISWDILCDTDSK